MKCKTGMKYEKFIKATKAIWAELLCFKIKQQVDWINVCKYNNANDNYPINNTSVYEERISKKVLDCINYLLSWYFSKCFIVAIKGYQKCQKDCWSMKE